jgi:hypothetical protein
MQSTTSEDSRADELAQVAITMHGAGDPAWREQARAAIAAVATSQLSHRERRRLARDVVDRLAPLLHTNGSAMHRYLPSDRAEDYDDGTRGVWCVCECGLGRWQQGVDMARAAVDADAA